MTRRRESNPSVVLAVIVHLVDLTLAIDNVRLSVVILVFTGYDE
jgi:hypothetical protein